MFDQLFFRSDALTRQLAAQLVDERRQYLAHCAAQGMSKCTLHIKARLLLSIAEYLRLAERPNDAISLVEISTSRHFSGWTLGASSRSRCETKAKADESIVRRPIRLTSAAIWIITAKTHAPSVAAFACFFCRRQCLGAARLGHA